MPDVSSAGRKNAMTTVFLRAGTQSTADVITPQVPILADLRASMMARPYAIHLDPLFVDPQTYESAEKEMTTILEQRGFVRRDRRGNIVLIQRAEMLERNFLLMGVPVVCQES